MTRFAPTAPVHLLQRFHTKGVLGNYHLLLAHDVVKEDRRDLYRDLFSNMAGVNKVVIMDNSIVELGSAVALGTVMNAVACTNANVVVLPDVMQQGPETTQSTLKAIDSWARILGVGDTIVLPPNIGDLDESLPHNHERSFMVVPQGRDLKEWIACAESLAKHDYRIKWWGIPRVFGDHIHSRQLAVEICRTLNPNRNIHLLGFCENILEDMITCQMYGVDGIDSAVPIRAASLGIPISLNMKLPPRGNWWEEAVYDPMMLSHMEQVRDWISVNKSEPMLVDTKATARYIGDRR